MRVHKSRLTICAMAGILVGCGGSKDDPAASTTQAQATPTVNAILPGAPGEPSKTVTATPTPEGGGFVPADVDFVRGMIHHHDQAITMTGWVPDRTSNTSLRLLAKRMEVSQTDEVAFLRTWLETRGEDPNAQHDEHAASMPGMLTQEQLDALETAKGKAFDKLFLAYMTQHHEGAIQMVAQLFGEGGGTETQLYQFAQHVDSDQSIEIKRMTQLAAKL
jgi:uncharacterized protein (DUF305 family)